MAWTRRLWLKLQTLFRRQQIAHRLDDEIQFHLDQQIGENIAAGMDPEAARHAALRAFGNRTVLKEETRETWVDVGLNKSARTCATVPQACKEGEITVQPYKYTTADGRNAADLSLDKQVRYRTRTVHL